MKKFGIGSGNNEWTMIYCVCTPVAGPVAGKMHHFYLRTAQETYYLFSQDYRRGVQNYFGGKGVYLEDALDYSKSNRDSAVTRTMDKLPVYIRYIEKEYGIAVLERTKFCGKCDPHRTAKQRNRDRDRSLLYAG